MRIIRVPRVFPADGFDFTHIAFNEVRLADLTMAEPTTIRPVLEALLTVNGKIVEKVEILLRVVLPQYEPSRIDNLPTSERFANLHLLASFEGPSYAIVPIIGIDLLEIGRILSEGGRRAVRGNIIGRIFGNMIDRGTCYGSVIQLEEQRLKRIQGMQNACARVMSHSEIRRRSGR